MTYPEQPIVVPGEPTWLPPPQQVADLLRARTKDDQGNELGTWTADTRPTEYEVRGLIETAAGDLLAAVGLLAPDSDDPRGAAQALTAYRAAVLVELSYFPEQVTVQQSAYAEYKAMWDAGIDRLRDELAGPPGGGSTYSTQMEISTVAYYYGGLLYPAGSIYQPLLEQGAINVPEQETAEPQLPTDPIQYVNGVPQP